jgi:hypothetical protein
MTSERSRRNVGSPPESQRSVIGGMVCETFSICANVMSPGWFSSS